MDKYKFIEFLIETGALKFGDFLTKSGRKSPYFFKRNKMEVIKVERKFAPCNISRWDDEGETHDAAISSRGHRSIVCLCDVTSEAGIEDKEN